jgi:hypothetical protein
MRPCLEKIHHKKSTGEVAQGKGPEFKPKHFKKKKKKTTRECHYIPTKMANIKKTSNQVKARM